MTVPPEEPVIINGGEIACVRLLPEPRARISNLPAGTVIHLTATNPAAGRPGATCLATPTSAPFPLPRQHALGTFSAPVTADPASP